MICQRCQTEFDCNPGKCWCDLMPQIAAPWSRTQCHWVKPSDNVGSDRLVVSIDSDTCLCPKCLEKLIKEANSLANTKDIC